MNKTTPIPVDLISSKELSALAFKLLCVVMSFEKNEPINHAIVSQYMKESPRTLQRATNELKELGYLKISPEHNGVRFSKWKWEVTL